MLPKIIIEITDILHNPNMMPHSTSHSRPFSLTLTLSFSFALHHKLSLSISLALVVHKFRNPVQETIKIEMKTDL